ncbi:unnamed protein product [Cylindrotheca closterium]|uniref:Ricin B lectin domain-containing protein n=1 Tax=Cylindrotheca closterium TaxID=2856 RepID=A0AAD2FNF8_9STRA|nr:unnamed protein product [Cylindrotheca closterium]
MTFPTYFSFDSEKQDEEHNMRPSMVKKKQAWQKTTLAPFLTRKTGRHQNEKVLDRQNSYLSTTTATSNSTQTDLGDVLDPQSDDSILEEEDENLVQNLKTQSPPRTPGTIASEESFLSSDDSTVEPVTSKKSLLKRLDETVDESKSEAQETEEVFLPNDDSTFSSGKESISSDPERLAGDSAHSSISSNSTGTAEKADVSAMEQESPSSPTELVSENSLTDDSANSSTSSKTTAEKADGFSAQEGLVPPELVTENSLKDDSASSNISSNSATAAAVAPVPTILEADYVVPTTGAEPEEHVGSSVSDSASQILKKYLFGGLAMSLTTFVTMGSVARPIQVDTEEAEVQTVPSLDASEQSSNDGDVKNTMQTPSAAKDCEIPVTNLHDDADDIIFVDEDVESTQLERPELKSPLSPISERNIRQLQFLTPNSGLKEKEDLSKGPTQDIFSIPNMLEEDEEAQFALSPGRVKVDELQEGYAAYESSKLKGDSTTDNGSDDPDGSKELSFESDAPTKKQSGKEEGPASHAKSIRMLCFVVLFAALVAVTLPFFMDTTVSASAAIETASPSVSMEPSSAPSLSQEPSDSPSLKPSIYPTISDVPTIAPSGHPTLSQSPSMVPSISDAPSLKPSIAPTESMEPSESPSEVPSDIPSSVPSESPSLRPSVSMLPSSLPSLMPSPEPTDRPTQHPTITFQPSRRPTRSPTREPTFEPTEYPTRRPTRSPTREPTFEPTEYPTRPPITPPPPADLADAFKIRLYWNESYFWQEENVERFWCMECVKCAEYGNLDGFDHGCVSHQTGDETRCAAGDSMWVRECEGRGNRFNIQGSEENGFMVRIARTDLCIERIKEQHQLLFVQHCDRGSPWQRFLPWNDYHKFQLKPIGYKGRPEVESECVSQLHHPKSGELLALHNCALSREYETLFWEKY